MKSLSYIFLLTFLVSFGSTSDIKYFRTEDDFLRGIEITEKRLGWKAYLEVHYDTEDRVIKIQHFKRKRKLLTYVDFKYDSTTGDLALRSFFNAKGNLIKDILFGPEENLSLKYIRYVYGVDHVLDFGDRFTEVVYKDNKPSVTKFYDVNTFQYGEIEYFYDGSGELRQEDWISKPSDQLVRRFLYTYYPEDGITELWEYDSTLAQVTHLKLTPDNKALLFTVGFPQDSSFINTSRVSYTLTENLVSGAIKWEWEGGRPDFNAPHTALLSPSEMKAGTYDLLQLVNSPDLVDSATYKITFSGVGKSEYPSVDITIEQVEYDLVPPEYTTSIDPVISNPIISYSLSENLSKGEFRWIWTGGEVDTLAPHIFMISPGLANAGEHNDVLFLDELPLNDGSVYSIEFRGEDFAGNVGSLTILEGIRFDQTPPKFLTVFPEDHGFMNNKRVSYELSENLASGMVIWYQLNDDLDTVNIHVTDLITKELEAGFHDQILFTDAPILIDGNVYHVEWRAVDFAGNTSDTLRMRHITHDTTAPVLVIEKPANHASINQSSVVYSFSENMSEAVIEWTKSGWGIEDTTITVQLKRNWLVEGSNLILDPEISPKLDDGTRYDITVKGRDMAGNEAKPYRVFSVLYDVTPPQISDLFPSDSVFVNSSEISYTLSESAIEGTVIWMQVSGKFDTKSPFVISLKNEELVEGTHDMGQLINKPNLQDSSIYQIMFVFADSAGNVSEQKVVNWVTFDTSSPELDVMTPDHDIAVSTSNVTWVTEENLRSATIVWEWINGAFDIFSLHEIAITEKGLNKGKHTEIELSLPDLVEGAVYNVFMKGIDRAGNQATSEIVTNVLFDATSPMISGFTPRDNSFINSVEITYELSENLTNGTVIWEQTEGIPDPLTPHISQLADEELLKGHHKNIQLTDMPVLNDGSIYNITFSGEDQADNESNTILIKNITYDVTSPEFEVSYPVAYTPIPNTMVSYGISENLYEGEIIYRWVGGSPDGNEHVVNLKNEELKSGDHSENLFTDVGLIEGAIYNVIFKGKDAAGNESFPIIISGVLFDTTPPQFVDILSQDGIIFRTPSIAWALNESLEKGMIVWEQTGGPIDQNSPHKVDLVDKELLSGAHLFNLTNAPILQDSALYTLKFVGEDGAGNVSDTMFIKNVQYDFSLPRIEVTYPLANGYTSSPRLSYKLSEDLADATLIWTWQGGNKDEKSLHFLSLKEEEIKEGIYQKFSFVEKPELIADAVYSIEFSGWDLAGNEAIPVIIPNIVYDPVPPQFTVTFPNNGMYVNHEKIEYSISEHVVSGTVSWKQVGGVNDPESPHIMELYGDELKGDVLFSGRLFNSPKLQDGSVYDILFTGIDKAGNVSDTTKVSNVKYDVTKPELIVQYPQSNSYARTNSISYTLNENIKIGVITWQRTGGEEDPDSPYNIPLIDDELSQGLHGNQVLLNSPDLIDGSIYELTFIGIDSAGNQSEPVVIPNVIFDATPPVISIFFPTKGSYVNNHLISYTLSETLAEGTVEWKTIGGIPDPESPHQVTLSNEELKEGSHLDVTLVNQSDLNDGTIYRISMSGKDFAGNVSDTIVVDSVTYDITIPEISVSYPTVNTFVKSTTLSYHLSEYLSEGTITWVWAGGTPDSRAPHRGSLTEDERINGDHDEVKIAGSPILVDGAIYSIIFNGRDRAGNQAEATEINDIIYDGTPPFITNVYPKNDSFINKPVVSYIMSEKLASGKYIWVTKDRKSGSDTIQEVMLTGEELKSGSHDSLDFTGRIELQDGNRYTIKVVGEDAAGNLSDTLYIKNVTYDITAPIVAVNYPSNESSVNNVEIGFTLSEELLSGKVIWTYISGIPDEKAPHVVNLEKVKKEAGEHPRSGLLFPPKLVDGAVYNLSLFGEDFAGNVSDTVSVDNVLFDVTKPEIAIHSPLSSSAQNHVKIFYSLSENLADGKLIWERTGGKTDENSPHILEIVEEGLETGDHMDFEAFPTKALKDGSIYRIKMIGVDMAGNLADSVMVYDVLYDTTTPVYQILNPVARTEMNSTVLSYTLSESLEEANLTWERMGGEEDPNSPHQVTLSVEEKLSGQHENIVLLNSPQLVNGTIYKLTLLGRDKAGNSGKEVIIPNIRYDDEPPILTITSPKAGSFINSSKLTYSLSEKLKEGLVSWIWMDGTEDEQAPHEVHLTDTELTAGLHSDIVPVESPDLTEGAIYDIKFEGMDYAGNEAITVKISGVRFDAQPPIFTWISPTDSLYINSFEIGYTLSENLKIGTLIWDRTGGADDPDSPHTVELVDGELEFGLHERILLKNTPPIIDGANYDIRFEGSDIAGNEADSKTVKNILFDITPPEIVADYPAPGSSVNSSTISYMITESLSKGKITWTPWSNGKENMNSIIERDLISHLLVKGDHRDVILNPDLVSGTNYTVKISGVDLAGNKASGMIIESVTFDNEPPRLHIEIPGDNKFINEPRITYSLSEHLESASLIWTWISGTEDSRSPHSIKLVSEELDSGLHSDVLLTNSPELQDGAIYSITLQGTDLGENEGNPVTIEQMLFDTTSPQISLKSPENGEYINSLKLSYTISENLQEAKVSWIRTGGIEDPDSPHIILMEGNELEMGEQIDKELTQQPGLVDGAIYVLKIIGSDLAGNNSTEIVVEDVSYDITLPVLTDFSPVDGFYINKIEVSYTLSETLSEGMMTWEATDGITDSKSPHTVILTGDELSTGPHSNILLSNSPDLVSGVEYRINISGVDLAGNKADLAEIEHVTYDTVRPVITLLAPVNQSYVNHSRISYELSELLDSGSIKWIPQSGGNEITKRFSGGMLERGEHFDVVLSVPPQLTDGEIYTLIVEGSDKAGNNAKPAEVEWMAYDVTQPTITIDLPEPHTLVKEKVINLTISEDLDSAKIMWVRESGGTDENSPHILKLIGDYLKKGQHSSVKLEGSDAIQVGSIYSITVQGIDLAGNQSSRMTIRGIDVIQDLEGDWVYKGALITVIWSFHGETNFTQGVMMGSRISNEEPGTYILDFTTKPFKMEINFESGIKRYTLFEFTGNNKLKVVISTKPPESWTDGDLMFFEKTEYSVP
ncbi:MAG: hypothetical protein IIB44_09330 [Candidatus Marinimicrobia bacterium]|nr:hypothetical protein [Candidatus Neomarinimicrobiota bacterium]